MWVGMAAGTCLWNLRFSEAKVGGGGGGAVICSSCGVRWELSMYDMCTLSGEGSCRLSVLFWLFSSSLGLP